MEPADQVYMDSPGNTGVTYKSRVPASPTKRVETQRTVTPDGTVITTVTTTTARPKQMTGKPGTNSEYFMYCIDLFYHCIIRDLGFFIFFSKKYWEGTRWKIWVRFDLFNREIEIRRLSFLNLSGIYTLKMVLAGVSEKPFHMISTSPYEKTKSHSFSDCFKVK